jgi:hypothetical protein
MRGIAPLLALALLGCGSAAEPAGAPPVAGPDDFVVPVETADALALSRLNSFADLPVLGSTVHRQQSSRDRLTGAPPPVALVANGNRDMNNFVCKSDDAEADPAQLVPYVFDQEACAENYVHGFVLARFEGAGELVRFWLTALSLRAGSFDDEVFRLYVDDAPSPLVQVPLASVVDGSAGEIFAPPFGAGAPDHVAWRYPVVFAKKLIVAVDRLGALDLVYHQSDVLLSAEPRHAAKQRLAARDDAIPALAPTFGAPVAITLPAGASQEVLSLSGPRTLRAVRVTSADDLSDVQLMASFDGAQTMDLPLLELFAAASAEPDGASLALGPGLELRLPMPFSSSTHWTLANHGSSPVSLTLETDDAPGVPEGDWRPLHVIRSETLAPTTAADHPVANLTGPGRVVGVCALLQGHGLSTGFADPLNFLEGDERVTLDGELAIDGTGTEDYFDSAFYFASGSFASPFAQAWGVDPAGEISACRWHVLSDRLDFQSQLEFQLEIGPGAPDLLDRYRTVTFAYR